MKNIYTSVIAMTLLSGTAMAQQLPNADFEGGWSTCTPWTGGNGNVTIGENPDNWCISHVMGITKTWAFVSAGTGKKAMGEKFTYPVGEDKTSTAVKVFNDETGAMSITRVVPGYCTLGTTWSTAHGTDSKTHDGGAWGGISFASRPDAMQLMYQRAYADASAASEPASFVIYLWNGTTTQANVPVTITTGIGSGPATTTMTNRDRNILFRGESTTTGGEVTYSDDFELIAKAIVTKAGEVSDWTELEIPIEYLTSSTPSMINVIFAANDYFNTASATKGNSLIVDNIKLIYYSRLASLKINGVDIEGFASDKYDYTVDADAMPAADQIAAACMGNSGTAKANVEINAEAKTATVTVSNAQGADADGQTSHVYTIHFNIPEKATIVSTKKFTGLLTVDLGEDPQEVPDTEVELREYSDGTYGMYLADFAGMGAIELNGMKLEGEALTGRVEGLALSGGAIQANVDLTGTYDGTDLELHLDIDAYAPVELPVKVDFTTKVSQGPKVVDSRDFIGLLRVDLGEGAQDIDNTTVTLNKFDDGTYGMYLADFAEMGAIELNGIALNGTQMSGYVPGFSLAGGAIQANVTLAGNYEGSNLELHLDIAAYAPVELPVKVDFYSPASLGAIGEIASDNAASAEYYNLQGIRVSASELTPGIYVCRKGNEVKKVLVK